MEMLGERIFRVIVNIFCVVTLVAIMRRDDCDFMDVRVGGKTEHPYFFKNFPCQKLPKYLDDFYVFKLSYHLYELGYTLVKQRSRPDFPEYVLHHFMTWSLIFFSYSLNKIPIGAAVMILHDITDLTTTIFKLTVDITPILIQALSYGTLLVTWVYFRLWYFPLHVIGRILEECYEDQICAHTNYSYMTMLTAFLSILVCLHLFWFYLMIKGLYKRARSKKSFKDGVSLAGTTNETSND